MSGFSIQAIRLSFGPSEFFSLSNQVKPSLLKHGSQSCSKLSVFKLSDDRKQK